MNSDKYKKFMGSTLTAALVATAVVPTAGVAAEEAQKPFPDVELGTPYTEPISKLKEAGVMGGYPDGTFGIRTKLTRAHAAIMFTNIRDLNTNVAAAPFADVKQDVYYTDAINAAYAAGVIQGHTEESFAPNDNLTRGQMAVMMVQAYDLEMVTDVELPFSDLSEDHWATPFVKTLYANGLFAGKSTANGALAAVGETVDRGDFAILLAATDIEFGHKLVTPEEPAELVVESVQAISQTIAKSTPTDLKFNINGEEYTKESFEDKFGEEGYSLKFLFNNTGLSTASGVSGEVNTDLETFKYAVEVSKDGEKVNTVTSSDFVEVKVADATVATSVQEIQLQHKSDSKEWKNATVSASDAVQIGASVFSNALGQSNNDKDENGNATTAATALVKPEVEKITSSDVTTAYYQDGKIVVLADGEVTFTVKFKDIKETKQITVKTVATQDVTSISAEDQKVKASTEGQTVTFTVLDQNNEAVRVNQTEVFYTLTKSGDVEADAASIQTDAAGKVTVNVNKAEGDYTVNVYTKADKQTKLGSFAVKAIDVADDAKIDKYELSFADKEKTTVDINSSKSQSTLTVNAKASISGIEVALPDNVKVKSSNNEIIKAEAVGTLKEDGVITVTGLKTGKANVILYTEEGDLVTELATLEVQVVNTAPQFTTLTLKANTKVDGYAGAADSAELKEAVANAVREDVVITQIEKVTPLKVEGKVLVKFKSEFGGKTIALDAEFNDVTLNSAEVTEADTLVFTFSDAVEVPGELVITLSGVDEGVTVAEEDILVEGNKVTIKSAQSYGLAGDTIEIEDITGLTTEKGYTVKVNIALTEETV